MRTSPFDYKVWNIEAMCGYKPKTTFYEDFGMQNITVKMPSLTHTKDVWSLGRMM